jgi:nicotinate dehydrogenase subunit B
MEQIPKPIIDFPKLKDWLKITPEKKVIFFSGRVELGQGNKTALEMMIADELDDLPEAINLQMARTDCTPNEGFTAGSMSIVHGGQALRWVAASFRR